jgi:two-component system, chemotaxis family, response regulator Rcp1
MEISSRAPRAFEILLVEDREEDAELARYAFRGVPVAFNLHVVSDGFEALDFVRQKAPYKSALRPDIILLDLNMPGMDGRELLAELKRDDDLKSIPAIVLTTSSAPEDVCYAYRTQAAAFITKPFELVRFSQIIRSFADIFLSGDAQLPSPSARWSVSWPSSAGRPA